MRRHALPPQRSARRGNAAAVEMAARRVATAPWRASLGLPSHRVPKEHLVAVIRAELKRTGTNEPYLLVATPRGWDYWLELDTPQGYIDYDLGASGNHPQGYCQCIDTADHDGDHAEGHVLGGGDPPEGWRIVAWPRAPHGIRRFILSELQALPTYYRTPEEAAWAWLRRQGGPEGPR